MNCRTKLLKLERIEGKVFISELQLIMINWDECKHEGHVKRHLLEIDKENT